MTTDARLVGEHRQAHFRYGVVFLIILAVLVFGIVAPDANWARAIDVVLAGALLVALATSQALHPGTPPALARPGRCRPGRGPRDRDRDLLGGAHVRRGHAAASGGPRRAWRRPAATRPRGGGQRPRSRWGLAIYLIAGLLFASLISFVAHVHCGPYFTQGAHVFGGERGYYSFTVLTATGFGDYTAAYGFGHALAVLEMLTGCAKVATARSTTTTPPSRGGSSRR